MPDTLIALVLGAMVLMASLLSVELAVSVSIIEIVLGVIAGNALGLEPTPWVEHLAGLGSMVLTFLAGAEVKVEAMRARIKESLLIGGLSFIGPFLGSWLFSFYVLGWSQPASLIAGVALSTTSLAVVYAVLVETGLSSSAIGQVIMASCFVTDFGTALAPNVIFAKMSWKTLLFLALSAFAILGLPRLARGLFRRYSQQVVEPEAKVLLLALAFFMFLGAFSGSHAVLPVFVFGLSVSQTFDQYPDVQRKLRIMAFAILTPVFFIKAGLNVSVSDLYAAIIPLLAFLTIKLVTKAVCVYPVARRYVPQDAVFTTLLMSTGLTFGTISSMYGLSAGIIDRGQFSILVTVVILSAILPTLVAQRWFMPEAATSVGGRGQPNTQAPPVSAGQ
ncbi:MAG: cation:proton antiporter [Bacillota bacterium]|nr:MAG: cation:proton antiporter [Bacillota bacterium]